MRHPHRVLALLGESRVIHEPRGDRAMTIHLRQDDVAGDAEHRRILPGGVGDQVMHRLVPCPDVPRVDARGHGLDALALTREAQPGEVGPQRLVPIPVPQRLCQPLHGVTEPSRPSIARFGCHALTMARHPPSGPIFCDTIVLRK